MRKIICMGIMLLMLASSFSLCFATDQSTPAEEEISLRYVTAQRVTCETSITGGSASYWVIVRPNTSTSISYINATLKLVNSSGTVVKSTTQKISLSAGFFKLTDSKSSLARGTYYAEYILKVYKGSSLVETIKGKSVSVKY